MIVRIARRPRYTSIAADVLGDARLSYGALGLLVYLLGRPDDWTVRVLQLARSRQTSEYAVGQLLGELRRNGYAEIVTMRHPKSGRLAGRSYVIHERPIDVVADDDAPPPADDAGTALELVPLAAPLAAYRDAFGADVLAGLSDTQRTRLARCTDAEAWAATLDVWTGNGHNPRSVFNLVDRYDATLKERAEGMGGRPAGGREAAGGTAGAAGGTVRRDGNAVTAQSVAESTEEAAALLDGMRRDPPPPMRRLDFRADDFGPEPFDSFDPDDDE